ncbi:zinc-binding dehydrogenase [Maribellus sp. YY47]|uniref:zinc-binding dehydrogenase n=1 Tax=Maribellus sp. YY47 TaxID=2929486 RepID=UPI002000B56B|nr:zinc-binding dehydrogenase [Maribellus sp. YY47]MCK3684813.1 zinc-binding dehydrogenase [Maribellus sp. YY47]
MSEKATAWVFSGIRNTLDCREIELPKLGEGEILVKNLTCSICKSDLHTFSGTRPGPVPTILGHEIVGKIVDLPDKCVLDFTGQRLNTGDLITWTIMASCGECSYCKRGIPQKCRLLKKYGHEKLDEHFQLTGGFSSHTHLYPGTATFKLPADIDQRLLAGLNCSWATVMAAIRSAGTIEGKNVLITGAGMLGILAVMVCRELDAAKILVCEKDQKRLDLTKEFGADLCISESLQETSVKTGVSEFLQNEPVDIIFEMTGSNEMVKNAFEYAGTGASIILVGSVFPVDNVEVNPEKIVRKLLQIKGIHNYTPEDLASAIEILKQTHQKYPLEKLFDDRCFNLNNVDLALEHAAQSSSHRVIIDLMD